MPRGTAGNRGRTNDPEGLRRRLVDAAFAAFYGQGYHSTALHDLRRAAGVTGGALSHHFPTKKDLGLAVIRDRVAEAVDETWIAPIRSAPTAVDGILAVFDRIIAELDDRRAVTGCPLNNLALELSLDDPDFRMAIDAVFARWRTAIADKLRDDLAAGKAEGLDPERFATFVVAAYSGAMAMAKASQSTAPLKACAEQIAQFAQAGPWRADETDG